MKYFGGKFATWNEMIIFYTIRGEEIYIYIYKRMENDRFLGKIVMKK